MTIPLIAQFLFLALLLGFSAFFSGSETALFSLNRLSLEKIGRVSPSRAGLVGQLLNRPRRLLVSIVMGNMLVNIFASALAERITSRFFAAPALAAFSWVFSTVVMAFLILILGEIIPKTIAIHRAGAISLRVAPAITVLNRVLAWPVAAVRFVSDRIVGALENGRATEEPLTKEELASAISVDSSLRGDERERIIDIFELGDKNVRQLMTPRTEIVSFEVDTPLEEIASVIRSREYSRIPIYSGKKENVIGILYPKDLIAARVKSVGRIAVGDYLRPPFFVPETMKAARLLKEFLRRKIHIALVVDEYGGLSGLITLDDLVEEIVGEIWERGEILPRLEAVDEDTVRIHGRVELDYLNQTLGLDLFSEENVTLGGLICEQLGRIPAPGEIWRRADLEVEVISLKGPRVEEALIRKQGLGRSVPPPEGLKR